MYVPCVVCLGGAEDGVMRMAARPMMAAMPEGMRGGAPRAFDAYAGGVFCESLPLDSAVGPF